MALARDEAATAATSMHSARAVLSSFMRVECQTWSWTEPLKNLLEYRTLVWLARSASVVPGRATRASLMRIASATIESRVTGMRARRMPTAALSSASSNSRNSEARLPF